MEHDIVAILSLILEAEVYAEESYLALKFWLRSETHPFHSQSIGQNQSCDRLTVMGQGNITLLCS